MDSRRNISTNSETLPITMEGVSRSNNNETRRNGVSSTERNRLEEVEDTEVSPSDDSPPEDANATEDLNEGNEEVTGIDIDSPTGRATSLQQEIISGSTELEEVESDENFSEDENSQVLFESTQDVRNIEHLASLTDNTSGEDTDDETQPTW